jgi:large subunit ribosomal protein L23
VQVKQAVLELFSVRPVDCRVMWVKGKPKMTRTKSGFRRGSTTPWKKAIVTLKAGETIEAVEGV